MADYKIGQMLKLREDVEFKEFFGGKKFVKKGTRIWIGADKFAHYQDGTIQPLAEDFTIEGYDGRGITERIFAQLKTDLPLDEFCEEYEVDSEDIKEAIGYALEELGM